MPNDVRTCGQNCECYDSQSGKCCLYKALINPDKIKPLQARAYEGDSCKYNLTVGEETPHTPQQFLFVLHQRADPFIAFPSARLICLSDLDPEVLTGLAQRVKTSATQLQH